MKNVKLIYKPKFRLANHRTISVRFCSYVFCFMFIPLNLLTSFNNTLYAQSGNSISRESSNVFPRPQDPNSQVVQGLRLAGIKSSREKDEQRSRTQLKEMIEQLRSIKLSLDNQVSRPIVVPQQTQEQEPNEVPKSDVYPQKTEKSEESRENVESQASSGQIDNKTLQMLQDLMQNPEELSNPFELAEVLFLSGRLREAAVSYQEALHRIDAKDISMAETRAWILFQIGNSFKSNDMPAAGKVYGQLIAEYPNSSWAELAQAQANLIDWLQRDKPEELIADNKSLETEVEN